MKIEFNSIEEILAFASMIDRSRNNQPSAASEPPNAHLTPTASYQPPQEAAPVGYEATRPAHVERPEDCVVHWGKFNGTRLADLRLDDVRWYAETWQPKPYQGQISPKDENLKRCAQRMMDALDGNDIPF